MAKTSTPRKPTDHRFQWRDIKLRVRHTPDYINKGWSMLEVFVVAPKGAPLPVTATGYRSHFLDEAELKAAGGPITFMRAWLDKMAKSKAWQKAEFTWRQGDLFAQSDG
ncbi:MAG: hypothetical protein R3D67_21225 [Hyphomicrobiaceae bacterium]